MTRLQVLVDEYTHAGMERVNPHPGDLFLRTGRGTSRRNLALVAAPAASPTHVEVAFYWQEPAERHVHRLGWLDCWGLWCCWGWWGCWSRDPCQDPGSGLGAGTRYRVSRRRPRPRRNAA